MKTLRFINKPEYFFNWRQLLRRVNNYSRQKSGVCRVQTSWGETFVVQSSETIGKSLVHMGVYDLVLSECLWRLIKPGQNVIDIGANIGYFSSMMANRVGASGKVISFEPHPALFLKLKNHMANKTQCEIHNLALSSNEGVLNLFIPQEFSGNEGIASLEKPVTGIAQEIPVSVKKLDDIIGDQKIHLIKIDVEGHELSVFKGAIKTLKKTENVLLEDFQGHSSPAIHFLQEQGFEVRRIFKKFWGPKLIDLHKAQSIPLWEPPNYLATRDIGGVERALKARGWHCLEKLF